MKKLVIAAGLVLAASIAFAPLAFAGETPPAPTCGQAIQDVVSFTGVADAQKVLDQANFPAQIKSFTDGFANQPSLAVLQKAVADAIAVDNAAGVKVDSAVTTAAKAALKTRQDLLASVQAKLDDATKALADAKAKLAVLVTIRDKACAPPVVVPPTTDPATPTTDPTSTVAPSSTPFPTLIPVPVPDTSSSQGDVSTPQVDAIPSAIDTGRA